MPITGKLCPFCKRENEETALVCRHCGARLEEQATGYIGKPEYSEGRPAHPSTEIESLIDLDLIPENGIGIQVAGETQPLYVPIHDELVIGRLKETAPLEDNFLDLSPMNAGTMGVSRRHVAIKRTPSGYDVIDLTSRNGSWLNSERLVPNRPYSLTSGSQLRIGNMRLLVVYRLIPKDTNKS